MHLSGQQYDFSGRGEGGGRGSLGEEGARERRRIKKRRRRREWWRRRRRGQERIKRRG